MNLPLAGRPWTEAEDSYLLISRHTMTQPAMARELKRTPESVKKRLQKITRPEYGPENKIRYRSAEAIWKAAQTLAGRVPMERGTWPRPTTDIATALAGRRYGP